MDSEIEQSERNKMESLRLISDREIHTQQQRMDSFADSFRRSLDSISAQAQENVQNQATLAKLKAELKGAEDILVKALAEKTRQDAKQMATRDSISVAKARIEELKRMVQLQRAKKNEYAETISRQSLSLATYEEQANQDTEQKGEIQKAISWYNKVLGLKIEGGHGVKFTFTNINIKNPNMEYYFTIHHGNDTYTLLGCDPHLNGTEELINELNRTSDLFKFARMMREMFQNAAMIGLLPQTASLHQVSSTVSRSAPVLSVPTERSESPTNKNDNLVRLGEANIQFEKICQQSESSKNIEEKPQDENLIHFGELNLKKISHEREMESQNGSSRKKQRIRQSPRVKDRK